MCLPVEGVRDVLRQEFLQSVLNQRCGITVLVDPQKIERITAAEIEGRLNSERAFIFYQKSRGEVTLYPEDNLQEFLNSLGYGHEPI